MTRPVVVLVLSVGILWSVSCDKVPVERPLTPKAQEKAREQTRENVAQPEREEGRDPKKQAFVEALEQHRGDPWRMDESAGVPSWFFRPDERLREYMPEGTMREWQAQFDCSGVKKPACNLHYEVDLARESAEDAVFEKASRLTDVGFQLVEEQGPSFKAIRPVEHSNAVEVVYVNRPPGMESVEMIAVLREPVEPIITSMLAQPRFAPVAQFAVEVVSVPNSINVEKPRYDDTIAYSVMFDLPEDKRKEVESYLEDIGFELVRRGEAEASTSKWRHSSGWKASLEGDESIYRRFLVYFTRYEASPAEKRAE
jgi:hypothetical protein